MVVRMVERCLPFCLLWRSANIKNNADLGRNFGGMLLHRSRTFPRRKLIFSLHKARAFFKINSRSLRTRLTAPLRSLLSNTNRFMYTCLKLNILNRLFSVENSIFVSRICCLKRYQKQNNKINLMSRAETWYEIIKFQREKCERRKPWKIHEERRRWEFHISGFFLSFYSRFELRHMVTTHYVSGTVSSGGTTWKE